MKFQLYIIFLFITFYSVQAQDSEIFWTKVNISQVDFKNAIDYSSEVRNFATYQLDETALIDAMDQVPKRFSGIPSNTHVKIPDGNGAYIDFKLYKSNLLPDSWENKYPNLKSYYGISAHSSLRLTLTPTGIYGMIQQPEKQIMINPLTDDSYMIFEKKDAFLDASSLMICELETQLPDDFSIKNLTQDDSSKIVNDGFLRSYDLAVATTGEYAQFHINEADAQNASISQQKEVVLSAIAVTIDRVNSIYERDFAVTLELIDNNDDIIYLDEVNDPYSNNTAGSLISENQTNIDSVIGFSNYDIGHVFSTGGGGLAGLGVVCTSSKASGVTGLNSPVGDPFDIDYVAHEMGHQFGATHTYNNFCNNNRTNATAFEPGSGSTVMAYAGICAPNVQNNSDAVFHFANVNQVFDFIQQSSGSICAELQPINNNAPVLNSALTDKTIPYGTPFVLEADISDPDNDSLTFSWEQIDNEISTQPPDSLAVGGPNFRSLLPSDDSKRFFPKYNTVLNGALSTEWEVLPWTSRSMSFGLLARDNNPAGGQSLADVIDLTVADAGPFEVTSQSTEGINWLPGEIKTISWNVNGTDTNGINTSEVDILLSTDGGLNFDTILASNVTNDGNHTISVPNIQAPFCRIKVQPVDNYYYAINAKDFAINTVVSTDCNIYANDVSEDIPDGAAPNTAGASLEKTITINEDLSIESLKVSVDISHSWINDLVIKLESPAGTSIQLWDRNCADQDDIDITFSSTAQQIPNSCSSPFTGTFQPADEDTSLEDFVGESSLGDWKLIVTDYWDADDGTFESWNLDICYTSILSTQEIDNSPDFSITPNPASNNIVVQLIDNSEKNINIKFYDINGRVVKTDQIQKEVTQSMIDVSALSSGIYFVKVDNQQMSTVVKLIIR